MRITVIWTNPLTNHRQDWLWIQRYFNVDNELLVLSFKILHMINMLLSLVQTSQIKVIISYVEEIIAEFCQNYYTRVLCRVGTRVFKFGWFLSWEIVKTKCHLLSFFVCSPFTNQAWLYHIGGRVRSSKRCLKFQIFLPLQPNSIDCYTNFLLYCP